LDGGGIGHLRFFSYSSPSYTQIARYSLLENFRNSLLHKELAHLGSGGFEPSKAEPTDLQAIPKSLLYLSLLLPIYHFYRKR
jgi:hypothetical protein